MELIRNIFNFIDKYGTITIGMIISISLILGVIGVIIEKRRTGNSWIGQGFGRR